MTGARRRAEEMPVFPGLFQERGRKFRPDLVRSLADGRADAGDDRPAVGAQSTIASTMAFRTPSRAPRQPAWAAPMTRPRHPPAAPGRNRRSECPAPGPASRDHGIHFRGRLALPGRVRPRRPVGMNLVGGRSPGAPSAARARARFAARARLVAGPEAAIERGVEADADAAGRGEEGMADAGRSFRSDGQLRGRSPIVA